MRKERVVVFDGEDKFIKPRTKIYDRSKGVAYEASVAGETKEGVAFKEYMLKKDSVVALPSPSDADFCAKIRDFISTNGEGKATPDDIMKAYQLFQDNCVEKPAPPTQTEQPTTEPVFPDWQSLDCDTIDNEIRRIENELAVIRTTSEVRTRYENAVAAGRAEKERKCMRNPPPLGVVDTPPPPPPTLLPSGVSLSTPTLGQLPKPKAMPLEDGGSKPEPNKGSNWLIWVLLGGAALYFLTRKRD
jgi:hypothetical protein